MTYQLLGKPVALKRPRFSIYKHVYDSQKAEKLRDQLAIKWQHGDKPIYNEPLYLIASFVFEPPKSMSKDKAQALYGKQYDKHIDLDNLVKYLADVCNGVLYTDDKYITSTHSEKIYGPESKTIFSIKTF
jgi:Holliday junction resolvase RusA-like endonuclease